MKATEKMKISIHARAGAGRKPMAPGQRKRTLSVRLPPDIIDWLDERAKRGQSRAKIVEEALRRRISSEEGRK